MEREGSSRSGGEKGGEARTAEAERPEEQRSSYDDLAEHLKGIEGPEHDIAMLLALNWQRMLGALVLILLVVWLVGEGMDAADKRKGEASQSFSEIQHSFAQVTTSSGEPSESAKNTPKEAEKGEQSTEQQSAEEKAKVSFEDNISLLKESFQGSVYAELARLYQARSSLSQKDIRHASEVLAAFEVKDGLPASSEKPSVFSEEVFSRELAALLYARVMLVDPAQEKSSVREYLTQVIRNAAFVNLEALVLYLRISDSAKQRTEALEAAKELVAERPDLRDAVSLELSAMGLSL